MEMKVFQGGTLIDGTGKPPVHDSLVVTEGKKITFAGKQKDFKVPKGKRSKSLKRKARPSCPV
jgi:hypothetical protein